jgi:hypothetical protein
VEIANAVAGRYGVAATTAWKADGAELLDGGRRMLRARGAQTDRTGAAKAFADTVAEHDYLRGWHWTYRFVAALRGRDGLRRAMWPLERQRIADILSTPWDGPNGPATVADVDDGAGGTRKARIGDVLTSELAVARALAWHHAAPAGIVSPGPDDEMPPDVRKVARAGAPLRAALAAARTAAGAPDFTPPPTSWTDEHERVVIDALRAAAFAADPRLGSDADRVAAWPDWQETGGVRGPTNPNGFALPLADLPADERGLAASRKSFRFDAGGLPRSTP